MLSESELRDALRASANIQTKIDADAVLRKAKARRVPRQVAVSSISALAIVGVVIIGVNTLPALQLGKNAASEAGMLAASPLEAQDSGSGGSESKLVGSGEAGANSCGLPTTSVAPNPEGLTLSVHFSDSTPLNGGDVVGTVVLTNSGALPVSGWTAPAPTIIVSRDGVTVWHSNEAMVTVVTPISLAPGQSYSYDARLSPRECGLGDDSDGQFPDTLPPLAAGTYSISAELTLVRDDATTGESILVGSPATTINLR